MFFAATVLLSKDLWQSVGKCWLVFTLQFSYLISMQLKFSAVVPMTCCKREKKGWGLILWKLIFTYKTETKLKVQDTLLSEVFFCTV